MKRTRKTRAAELLKFAIEGPSTFGQHDAESIQRARDMYKLWSETWLLPLIKELVPEIAKGQVQYLGARR